MGDTSLLGPSTFLAFFGNISPQPCLILPLISETMLDLLSVGLALFVCNIAKDKRGMVLNLQCMIRCGIFEIVTSLNAHCWLV